MLKYSIYFLLVFISQLNSCKGTAQTKILDSNDTGMELILEENYSGFNEEEYILVRNQKELNAFFGKVNRTRKPGLPIPFVDFKNDMVLIWCGDSSAVSFPDLEINEIGDYLEVKKIKVKKVDVEKSLIVSPFSVYKLPLSSKKLKIESN